jgi:succinate dehydrogenase / fumarate reductase cytochrome b subunit
MLAVRAFQAFLGAFWGTPIGRKTIMAISGLGSALFLVFHLGGNLIFLSGRDAYQQYSAGLASLPFLLVIEVLLGLMALTHAGLGLVLFVQNLLARPIRYSRHAWAGGKTVASATMIYSGTLIFAFLLLHLWDVRFGGNAARPMYDRVAHPLAQPVHAALYAIGLTAVGLHVSHGATSALLTLGLRHELHDPWVDLSGRIFAWVLAVGFGVIVAWCLTHTGTVA